MPRITPDKKTWKNPSLNKTVYLVSQDGRSPQTQFTSLATSEYNIIFNGLSHEPATSFEVLATHRNHDSQLKLCVLERPPAPMSRVINVLFFFRDLAKYIYKWFGRLIFGAEHNTAREDQVAGYVDAFPDDIPLVIISSKQDTMTAHNSSLSLATQVAAKRIKLIHEGKSGIASVYFLQLDHATGKELERYENFLHAVYKKYSLPHIPEYADLGEKELDDAELMQSDLHAKATSQAIPLAPIIKEKILVASKDFDGCLFNIKKYHPSVDKDVIAHNKPLWSYLEQRGANFSKTYSMVGSARQSKGIDAEGSIMCNTGSCFTAIQKIADHLNFTLEPFLLADIWGDLPAGTSYRRIMGKNFWQEQHHCNIYDDSKLTLVYAQIHRMATKHPDAEIVYDFYDDRLDILSKLFRFFSKFPEMLPSNVTLCLHQYEGAEINAMAKINGVGIIDRHYRQTVVDMMELTNTDVFFMRVDEVTSRGLRRCYVWYEMILSYIDAFGEVQSNIPVKNPFFLAWVHEVCESNDRKQFRLTSEFIHQLINSDINLYDIHHRMSAALGTQCVDVIKPALLAMFQSNIESGSRIRDSVYTQKSANLQILIQQSQAREDQWVFYPHINLPNQDDDEIDDSSSDSSDELDSKSMDLPINKTERHLSDTRRHSVSTSSFFGTKTKSKAGMRDLKSGAVCGELISKEFV